MDSFEFNKIAGAVLATGVGVMAIGIVADMIFTPPHHAQPGYVIAVAETEDAGTGEPAEPQVEPIAARLQVASVEDGATAARKCQACHTFDEGGAAKVGPNLWDVVGAPVIHAEGFNYSAAMIEKGQEGMTWTFDNLDHFLENPKGAIPGTAMAFAGLKRPDERANVVAYLRSLSADPVPLPAAPETEAAAPGGDGGEPAGEAPPAGEAVPADTPASAAPGSGAEGTAADAPPAAAGEPATDDPPAEPDGSVTPTAPGTTAPPRDTAPADQPPATGQVEEDQPPGLEGPETAEPTAPQPGTGPETAPGPVDVPGGGTGDAAPAVETGPPASEAPAE